MAKMAKRILVVGGTGMLGRPVVERLAADGHDVRVMTRQRDLPIVDPKATTIRGDPRETADVKRGLEGCDALYLNLAAGSETTIAAPSSEAAHSAGISRIACISGATVCPRSRWFPATEEKFRAEEAVRASGVPHTIFRPTWFMESLPRFVVKGRAVVFGRQRHPFRWVAAADYAAMVSAAFAAGGGASRTLRVLGPEPIRMHDALTRYCRAIHPGIRVATMPISIARIVAILTGNQPLASIAKLMGYFDRVGEAGEGPEAADGMPRPATTLDQWIAARRL